MIWQQKTKSGKPLVLILPVKFMVFLEAGEFQETNLDTAGLEFKNQ